MKISDSEFSPKSCFLTKLSPNFVEANYKGCPKKTVIDPGFPNNAIYGQLNKAGIKFSSLETDRMRNEAFLFSRNREMK